MDYMQFIEELFVHHGYTLIVLSAFFESLIIVGTFLPGSIIVLLGGYYARQGDLNIVWVMMLAWIGMSIGDIVNYWLGSHSAIKYFSSTRLFRYLSQKEEGIPKYFQKYGMWIVFYAHIIGYLRSIVGFTAGAIHIPLRSYIRIVVFSSAVWSILYVLLGFAVGITIDDLGGIHKKVELIAVVILAVIILLKTLQHLAVTWLRR